MSSNFEYVRNDKYVDHRVILAGMMSLFKQRDFSEVDVINWCQEVETRNICDVDNMVKFVKIPLAVEDFTFIDKPCNVYRILDLFDGRNNPIPFTTNQNGTRLVVRRELRLTSVQMNFVGMPVMDDGTPLIIRGHENACIYKCLANALMEDFSLGKLNANFYDMIQKKATNYIIEARGTLRHKTREDWNKLNIIQGNIIPKIGGISLYHLNFK